MPRTSSSSSRPISPSRPRSLYPTSSRSVAKVSTGTPAPIQQPGFFSNVMQGFGLGAGQAIAHNIFRRDPAPLQISSKGSKEFEQCMKDNNNDTELCKQFT